MRIGSSLIGDAFADKSFVRYTVWKTPENWEEYKFSYIDT